MCRQFHKLRWEGPKACKVALTYRPVHTGKRACKGRARETGNVGQACCGQACRIRENAVTAPEWGESRRGSGERASGVSMRCGKGTLDGGSPALIAGGLAAGASRPRLLWPRHAWALFLIAENDDDDDVYYARGRRPKEDE